MVFALTPDGMVGCGGEESKKEYQPEALKWEGIVTYKYSEGYSSRGRSEHLQLLRCRFIIEKLFDISRRRPPALVLIAVDVAEQLDCFSSTTSASRKG